MAIDLDEFFKGLPTKHGSAFDRWLCEIGEAEAADFWIVLDGAEAKGVDFQFAIDRWAETHSPCPISAKALRDRWRRGRKSR